MKIPALFHRPWKDIFFALVPWALLFFVLISLGRKYADPAPPNHFVISTGDGEGDYLAFAKLYKEIIKAEGVNLEIRPSSGAMENYKRLKDPNSDVEVGFMQDGLGSDEDAPNLVSLGSLYYEPIWVFYRGPKILKRFSEFAGRRISVGPEGGGTRSLATQILKESGIDETKASFLPQKGKDAMDALTAGQSDAAFFLTTPDDALIKEMLADKNLHLLSLDQAEAITRRIPFLHHLVLPHGAIDLERNLPETDIDLVSPTATLLVKDTMHPALVYLLLKAASAVHAEPGIFEKKDEFPIDKDYQFPLSADAKYYYKSGVPFWLRYLPFWIATLVDRFIFLFIPIFALIFPMVKLVPQFLNWRVRSRIYQHYGELKFLETQISLQPEASKFAEYLEKIDKIEERVNLMKLPINYADHIYSLRGHIEFVRERLRRLKG